MPAMKPTVIGFGVPLYESVEGYTFTHLTALFAGWRDLAPADWVLKGPIIARGSVIADNRESIASALLGDGYDGAPGSESPSGTLSTRPADVIVWNDADCYLENPEDYIAIVRALLAARSAGRRVAAVGVAAPIQKTGELRPNVVPLPGTGNTLSFGRGLFPVDWIGFGVLATIADAYVGAPRPWFRHIPGDGPDAGGEDVSWCRDARARGWEILLDSDRLATHAFRAPHRLDRPGAPRRRETA